MGEWRKTPKGQQRKREAADRWGPPSSSGGGGNSYRGWSRGKPPRFPDEKAEVHWEERFCQINGIEWKQVVEIKRYLPQYKDITGWDDSAAKEAFDNAKARFWARINGLQPETPLPDPDSLLDSVDHDAAMSQHKLYQNLRGSLSEDEGDDSIDDWSSDDWGEGGVILWDSHYEKKEEDVVWDNNLTGWGDNYPIAATGWGDIPVQESVQPDTWGAVKTNWADNSVNPTGWGDVAADVEPSATYESIVPTGWGDAEEASTGQWNGGVSDANYWDYCGNGGNWYHQNGGNGWYQNQNNGYDYGASGETGQYLNYGRNYWNGSQFNTGNWSNYNHPNSENFSGENGYRHGAGKAGWGKNRNKTHNKGKQWKKREDSSRRFCAPLNQAPPSNDGWNVPRSVV